ncbi:MAG: acylphosphatase [Geodermatophilaceae bacterium]
MRTDPGASEASRLTIWVRGHVQGVGFRWWVRERAAALGLSGSASNLDDGSVEILVEGTRADCADLLAQVEGGKTPGRVRATTVRWGLPTGTTSFTLS